MPRALEEIEDKAAQVAHVLSLVPPRVWEAVVVGEPEYPFLRLLVDWYPFRLQTLITTITGLNDYQLRCRAEECYWPPLIRLFKQARPRDEEGALGVLRGFYRGERHARSKLARVERLLSSPYYQLLKSPNFTPEWLEAHLHEAWRLLAQSMRQAPHAKTIVFTMKLLAMLLTLNGHTRYHFEGIPIPVDKRIQSLTHALLGPPAPGEEETRAFWDRVLQRLRETHPRVNMVHLDSLLWQITTPSPAHAPRRLASLGAREAAAQLQRLLPQPGPGGI